jgi:hypothetical protein
MDKENVLHILNEILIIRKNEIILFARKWMEMKIIIKQNRLTNVFSHRQNLGMKK